MIIKPRVRGFMCITTHPLGCETNVKNQIDFILSLSFCFSQVLPPLPLLGQDNAQHSIHAITRTQHFWPIWPIWKQRFLATRAA